MMHVFQVHLTKLQKFARLSMVAQAIKPIPHGRVHVYICSANAMQYLFYIYIHNLE